MKQADGPISELSSGHVISNVFSISWKDIDIHAFPPFCLIQKCLTKIWREQEELTLLTSYWPSQPWFPSLLELTCKPTLILLREKLLLCPTGQQHPLVK
jgi:hypothetical protein